MRNLVPLAAVLIACAGTRADEPVRAPVPKNPPLPSIDGKYTLVAQYQTLVAVAGGKGNPWALPGGAAAGGGRGGAGGDVLSSRMTTTRSEATISKTEIVIDPRTATGPATTMEYTLDPTKSPIAIDVETVTVRGKKTKSLGVVEATGNRLVIALAKEGAERPKTVDEAEGVTVYYFQKAPPPPRVEFRIVALTVGKEEAAEKELNQLAKEGYELVTTTSPAAPDARSSVTTTHFILKRTVK